MSFPLPLRCQVFRKKPPFSSIPGIGERLPPVRIFSLEGVSASFWLSLRLPSVRIEAAAALSRWLCALRWLRPYCCPIRKGKRLQIYIFRFVVILRFRGRVLLGGILYAFCEKSIFLFCVFSLIFISGNILLYISVLREKHNLIIPENSPF